MSNMKSTSKELDIQYNYCDIHRLSIVIRILILIYTFVGVSYLLFIKSNPTCDCALLSTKKVLPQYLSTKSIKNPTMYVSTNTSTKTDEIASSGSKRHLLARNTPTLSPSWPPDASIKHNHDLITNLYDMLPNGIVIIWYGLISNIPAGWSLCDGTNGTPDLRDKFIIGGGNLYNLDDIGGATHTTLSINHLPTHSHHITNILSTTHTGHTHNTGTFSLSNQNSHSHTLNHTSLSSHNGHIHPCSTNTLNAGLHSHACSAATSPTGSHTHTCSASTTKDGAHDHTCSSSTSDSGTHAHTCTASTSAAGSHNHITVINGEEFGYLLQQRDDCMSTVIDTDMTCGEPDVREGGLMKDSEEHSHPASCSISETGLHGHSTSCSIGEAIPHGHTTICQTGSVVAHSHLVINCSTGSVGLHNHDTSCNTLAGGSHTHTLSGTTSYSSSHTHSITGLAGNDGVHSHMVTGTTDSIGNGNIINVLNPYYTAYYIMKIPYTFPTDNPTESPTLSPTNAPTIAPTQPPTKYPSKTPTQPPTNNPSKTPTRPPTNNPSQFPTNNPSKLPSKTPSQIPSLTPSKTPTDRSTSTPTLTFNPSVEPTKSPTIIPTFAPILQPTLAPSLSPTSVPTSPPTNNPSISPSITPSLSPTSSPTSPPSNNPTLTPSFSPTLSPTLSPTSAPSSNPSIAPSITPTTPPTIVPSIVPTAVPSIAPSNNPSFSSPTAPSIVPSIAPTLVPSLAPTSMPTQTCWNAKFKWYMIKSIKAPLNRNDMLLSGESLVSVNCQFILTMKENGNLILNGVVGEYIDPLYDDNGNIINNVENKMIIYDGWQTNTTIKHKSGDESTSIAQLKNGTLMVEQRELFAIGTGAAEFVPIELWKSDEYINENELILHLSNNGCLTLNQYNGSINTDYLSHDKSIWFVCAHHKNDNNNNNVITTTIIPTDSIESLNYVNIHGKIRLLLFWNVVISALLIVILCGCLCICLKLLFDNYKVADRDGSEFSPVTPHDADDVDVTLNDEMDNAIELWSMEAENSTNATGRRNHIYETGQFPGVMQDSL